jgi:hypothetical protein
MTGTLTTYPDGTARASCACGELDALKPSRRAAERVLDRHMFDAHGIG